MKKVLPVVFVLALVGWLFVPAGSPATVAPAQARPFIWDQDQLWSKLESDFIATRNLGCASVDERIDQQLAALAEDIAWLEAGDRSPRDERLDAMEKRLFATAPLVAACPEYVLATLDVVSQIRTELKRNSRDWDVRDSAARERVYRLLYGARMAIEEILLQSNVADVPDLVVGTDVPSQAPSVVVNGLRVHSGDILVSRGGAPVSALIARGNDFPGNFSHIAILHVSDEQEVSVIEAHIEVGVTVSTLEQYLADKKLRLMVLRLDDSLEALQADPVLPHRAASAALAEARERHVPYDFAMHYTEPSKKFCSEVASAPYGDLGVRLWEGLTTMSASGTAAWLAALGVEQFETHGPSDLEYDPKVVVVAEWRDPEALFDDHVDNAIIDAMLEGAERGDVIDYDYYYLPMARLMKAYSSLLNSIGRHGPVPEGMAATTALRSRWLDERHAAIKEDVLQRVSDFRREYGYEPPYWQLFAMAKAQIGVAD
ncbi:MAG: hypothetical protein KJP17_09695 [Gammaproteobacteria bacterium]|nr:hypothetical protein [Gammaproteobacteria bacterium]